MTDARIGYGTKYGVRRSGGPLVQIAEVINVTPGEATADRIDATHMLSPGRRREYISGLIDNGEASFEINWVPGNATDELLRDLMASGEVADHLITFPNGVTVEFEAAVTGFSKAIPIDDRMTATITVAVSGEETWGSEAAPTNSALPAISGVAQVGQVLTAWPGIWVNAPAYAYVWEADGVPIPGATGPTYTPVVGQIGDVITVVVTGSNTAGAASAESTGTAPVIAA
jgi:predicted secreted protein